MLESLCFSKHSLTPVKSAFKQDFTTNVSPPSKVCKDVKDTLTAFAHYIVCAFQPPFSHSYVFIQAAATRRVVCRAIWFELIKLLFQRVCTATTLLVLALTVNTIAAVRNLQISFCGVYKSM